MGINTKRVTAQLNTILKLMGYEKFGVQLEFCSEKRITELNMEWRNINEPTDVLSFPCFEFTAPEKFNRESQALMTYTRQLGSIVIAPGYVMDQCYWDKKEYDKAQMMSSSVDILEEEEKEEGVHIDRIA
eukprot:CAMPEP_0170423040 /NCGR_PEP_ID=MMETSP0117_2-20130122/36783_1 /TAXON_ID=400756 /ORGANISM="Durinskia baltica, Strain CSIRO CS-38" /LENGTH=129 /DNA_ID=CAMNT_0010681757 /DNA_START=185 /DNA_END=571 /DNA_ORIENTATION=-